MLLYRRPKLWILEAIIVFILLITISEIIGGNLINRITSVALLFTFMHCQITYRLSESQTSNEDINKVSCYKYANYYWIFKEMLWITIFILSELWTAIVGSIIFLIYPLWRKYYINNIQIKKHLQ